MNNYDLPLNLDAVTDDEELKILAETLANLASYARIRRQCAKLREAGAIGSALRREQILDDIYQELPVWAKW